MYQIVVFIAIFIGTSLCHGANHELEKLETRGSSQSSSPKTSRLRSWQDFKYFNDLYHSGHPEFTQFYQNEMMLEPRNLTSENTLNDLKRILAHPDFIAHAQNINIKALASLKFEENAILLDSLKSLQNLKNLTVGKLQKTPEPSNQSHFITNIHSLFGRLQELSVELVDLGSDCVLDQISSSMKSISSLNLGLYSYNKDPQEQSACLIRNLKNLTGITGLDFSPSNFSEEAKQALFPLLKNLRHLKLRKFQPKDLIQMAPYLTQLESLSFNVGTILSLDEASLSKIVQNLSHLKSLKLHGTEDKAATIYSDEDQDHLLQDNLMNDALMAMFPIWNQLEELELDGIYFQERTAIQIFSNAKNLKKLSLSTDSLCFELNLTTVLPDLSHLEEFTFNTAYPSIGTYLIPSIFENLHNLHTLKIKTWELSDETLIQNASFFNRLSHLQLHNTQITNEGFNHLAKHLKQVVHLDLALNKRFNIKVLKSTLKQLPLLQSLSLKSADSTIIPQPQEILEIFKGIPQVNAMDIDFWLAGEPAEKRKKYELFWRKMDQLRQKALSKEKQETHSKLGGWMRKIFRK